MNKYTCITFLFLIITTAVFTQEMEQNYHKDHTVFQLNKLKPHADFFGFESATLLDQNIPGSSKRFLSLNGIWKFKWTRSPENRIRNFFEQSLDDGQWETSPWTPAADCSQGASSDCAGNG